MIKRGPISYVVDGSEYKMTADEVEQYLDSYLKDYLLSIANITCEERLEAVEWFNAGNDVMDNPWYLYSDTGIPVNYIEAKRLVASMTPCNAISDLPKSRKLHNRFDHEQK